MKGEVDAIVLTGGLAHSEDLTKGIKEYVTFIAPLFVYPGEHEMEAIARGVRKVLEGKEQAKEYS